MRGLWDGPLLFSASLGIMGRGKSPAEMGTGMGGLGIVMGWGSRGSIFAIGFMSVMVN